MSFPLYQVDAFTDTPFAGNPAAVCLLAEERPASWRQRVASEMNLSETAFLQRAGEAWELRWFTPTEEVDLCGHATLAAAHVLWESGLLEEEATARFDTQSGRLSARREQVDNTLWITMNFPAEPPEPAPVPEQLAKALGAKPVFVGRNRMDLLAELEDEATVRTLSPDLEVLAQIEARGVIVTAPAESADADFVSRFFGPRVGVPEDPVTGSAHCCLGPYWHEKTNQNQLVGRQLSPRGGTVQVAPRGERVALGGQAVTVFRGRLVV